MNPTLHWGSLGISRRFQFLDPLGDWVAFAGYRCHEICHSSMANDGVEIWKALTKLPVSLAKVCSCLSLGLVSSKNRKEVAYQPIADFIPSPDFCQSFQQCKVLRLHLPTTVTSCLSASIYDCSIFNTLATRASCGSNQIPG